MPEISLRDIYKAFQFHFPSLYRMESKKFYIELPQKIKTDLSGYYLAYSKLIDYCLLINTNDKIPLFILVEVLLSDLSLVQTEA